MAGEKTEKATPKRKQDERKKGNVFMSRDIVTVASLFASFYAIKFLAPRLLHTMEQSICDFFALLPTQEQITQMDVRLFFVQGCIIFLQTAFPLLLVTSASAIFATMLQTKMLFSAKAFAFKAERINPLSGLKKMFSMRSAVELLKSMLKIVVLVYVVYSVVKEKLLILPHMTDMSFLQAMQYTSEVIMSFILKAGIVFLFLGAGDFLYQWWEYEKNLRMSKQEIKDEYKQIEGDPQIKGRQRSIQQQRSRRRMIQKVPQADLIIRNPTHFAIALKYDQTKDRAPVVIAKGSDGLALRIIRVAEEHGIYITENRPLARALFENVELDHEIPEEYFKAVAEILAFMYALKKDVK